MIVRKDAMIRKLSCQIDTDGFGSLYGDSGSTPLSGAMQASPIVASSLASIALAALAVVRDCSWANAGMFSRQDQDVPFPLPPFVSDAYGLVLYNPQLSLTVGIPGVDLFGPGESYGLRAIVIGTSEANPHLNDISLICTDQRQRRRSDGFTHTRMNRYGYIDAGTIRQQGQHQPEYVRRANDILTRDANESLPLQLDLLTQYLHGVAKALPRAYSVRSV